MNTSRHSRTHHKKGQTWTQVDHHHHSAHTAERKAQQSKRSDLGGRLLVRRWVEAVSFPRYNAVEMCD